MIVNPIFDKLEEDLGLSKKTMFFYTIMYSYFQEDGINYLVDHGIVNENNEADLRRYLLNAKHSDADSFAIKYPPLVPSQDKFFEFKTRIAKAGFDSMGIQGGVRKSGLISYGKDTVEAFESLVLVYPDLDLDKLVNCIIDFYSSVEYACKLDKYLRENAEADLLAYD